MTNIMQIILDIEHRAQAMSMENDEREKNFEAELNFEKQRLKAEYKKETEIEIIGLARSIAISGERQIREIEKAYKEQLEKLTECFTLNKDEWIEKIVNSVIRG